MIDVKSVSSSPSLGGCVLAGITTVRSSFSAGRFCAGAAVIDTPLAAVLVAGRGGRAALRCGAAWEGMVRSGIWLTLVASSSTAAASGLGGRTPADDGLLTAGRAVVAGLFL